MSFDAGADAYDRFMGRFSSPLAGELVQRLDLRPGLAALDVGCGTGALTARLVEALGDRQVSAADPSSALLTALRTRFPDVDAREAPAERLPFADASFDRVVASLVVHFMKDPAAGLTEMRRVARPGGLVAATVWDMVSGTGPLDLFWQEARDLDPDVTGERLLAGVAEGQLAELFATAGMSRHEATTLSVRLRFASFDEWWDPFTMGVGPAGSYVAGLDPDRRARLCDRCAELAGPPPFDVSGSAWCVVAHV